MEYLISCCAGISLGCMVDFILENDFEFYIKSKFKKATIYRNPISIVECDGILK